jgi:hypothetical protein
VSKIKQVVFVAGSNRHVCYFTALGDHLCLNKSLLYDENKTTYLHPVLKTTSYSGSKLGTFIKALIPGSGTKKYRGFAVESLPSDATAAGFRPGVVNSLCAVMPPSFVVNTTGHELTGTCALYDYLDANRAMLIPGAVVLAGYPPLAWGTNGKGPKPASLKALLAVNERQLQGMLDTTLQVDSKTAPMLARCLRSASKHQFGRPRGALQQLHRASERQRGYASAGNADHYIPAPHPSLNW